MTSETNPETAGISYAFDLDSTCGTSSGDLVKTLDAVGNTTCYSYDALHRNTSKTYSGSYALLTPSEYFVYDSATVNSVPMANAEARLAEAYTCFSPCSSKITDVGLSYTARGETSDVYESTPHSGGYYHVPASYWANGGPNKLNALSNGNPSLPGLPTFAYGADGEGRPTTVTAGSGQNPVTGTTYNPYGTPPQTTVSFGSGDSDVFNSDANTGRLTQYKFNVGSNAVTGALTWNPNGTLGQLAITDPLNSSNAQTCNYTHDDLTRIASANCGSIWSQTFTFDPFGNINKAGNSSFGATYSSSTNRMATIGTSTPTYDANGNVTNDFLHTYAWDANGRPVTIDGIGATYDALGRMVELNRSGVYGEIVYSPSGGKLALMNVQSLVKAFVPLTGGATAVYSSSGLAYYRHSDWLGSARLATTPTQTMYGDVAYAPYGETYAQSGTADFSFTGMNQDVDQSSNPAVLYDFLAREYGIQGRWPSPDPAGLLAVDPSTPQSWNRYAYVLNNPLAMTDPTGMEGVFCADPISCIIESIIWGIFDIFQFLFSPPPPPQAAPPPPGGYGAGIDPYGTWNEKLPKGVQVFPSVLPGGANPGGSGCTYGSGNCGGVIFSDQGINDQAPIQLPDFKISITVYESLLGLKQTVIHDNSAPGINPPSWGNFVNRFLPCYRAQLINNFFGNDDKTAITLTANLAAILTRHPAAVITAAAVDFAASARAGIACATISRRFLQ
jgi:RHS repeat-associated protein